MGDFNIDLCKCNYLKTMKEVKGLHQVITQPTLVTLKSEILIHHIYVNEKSNFTQSGVVPIGVSDHYLIYTVRKRIKQNKYQYVYIKYRDLKHADEHAYLQNLAKINWNDIKSLHNINDMWNKFKNNLFAVIDKHYPIRENRIRADSEKWINNSILSEMRQRDYLHRKDIKSKKETDWHFYRAARNGVLKQINEAKREFIDEAISFEIKGYVESSETPSIQDFPLNNVLS